MGAAVVQRADLALRVAHDDERRRPMRRVMKSLLFGISLSCASKVQVPPKMCVISASKIAGSV